jgi:hypothetical protein
MRITTVARKAKPTPMATSLNRFLLIIILAEYSGNEYNNPEVIKSIIAVTASHKLISDNDKGKIIDLNLAPCDTTLLWSSRQETLVVSELLQFCRKFLQERMPRRLQWGNPEG